MQFDRFVEELREKQYAPLATMSFREQYTHLGELWLKHLWSDPPAKLARATLRSANPAETSSDQPCSPDEPPSKRALREKYAIPEDGRVCQLLEGVCLSENGAKKALCSGDLILSTKVIINPNTGAPTDWVYNLRNDSFYDMNVTLDFESCKGVGAVTLEFKEERDNIINVIVMAKEAKSVAWLKPRKKKSVFAWENNSDEDDEMGSNSMKKKKKKTEIVASVKVTYLQSRQVSCQLLSEVCSSVFNVRVSKQLEAYFAGRPSENVYEWMQYHERAARIDNVSPRAALGRTLAFLLGEAKDFAIRLFSSLEMEGETRIKVLLGKLKAALLQTYGPHNVSLVMMCVAGRNKQVKELLEGDSLSQSYDSQHENLLSAARRRLFYTPKETFGPRTKHMKPFVFGRDPRAKEAWPRTLPFVAPLPVHGRSWKSHLTGQTALHIASASGHLHVVSTLLRHGWSYDECDYFGRTPEEVANLHDHAKVAKYLHNLQWGLPSNIMPKIEFLITKLAYELAEMSEHERVTNAKSLDNKYASVLGVEMHRGYSIHPITLVNAFRQLRQASVLAAAEAAIIQEICGYFKEQEAIEWKVLESKRNTAHSSYLIIKSLNTIATKVESDVNGSVFDSSSDPASDMSDGEGANLVNEKSQEVRSLKIELDSTNEDMSEPTVDADNYDMLNLWHVCLEGKHMCIIAALQHGHKLRYVIAEGWKSFSCQPKINYRRRGATWTDGGGKTVIHALASQKYPIPGSQMKPCLLAFLDNDWPAHRPDIKGLTPTDYAKRFNHKTLHSTMLALIKKPSLSITKANEDSDSENSDSDTDENDGTEEPVIKNWAFTKPATDQQNRALAALCTGTQKGSSATLVREAVFGGKSLFTAGSCKKPVLQCFKRDKDDFPVRYNPDWTCRFEPVLSEDLPEVDGLGFTALHIAAISGECETAGILVTAGWDPCARSARGHTPIDLSRICGWEALHHALQEVSEGSADFFGSLQVYSKSRCKDYTDKVSDTANETDYFWEQVDSLYNRESERRRLEALRVQGQDGPSKQRKARKKKKKKKKKQKQESDDDLNKGGILPSISTVTDDEIGTKQEPAANMTPSTRRKKTFFRGRLNFRVNPIIRDISLATWTCKCTTVNTASARTCKYCYRKKGFSVWVCDCTTINEVDTLLCTHCNLKKK